MSIVSSGILKALGKAYSLKTDDDMRMFDDLWEVYQVGNKFRRDNEEKLDDAVREAYGGLTDIVSGLTDGAPHGLDRVTHSRADKLVIFSDHHMVHRGHRHDYFFRFNQPLYVEVLERYERDGFTLVENGDVEELVIFEPTKAEAEKRRKLVRRPLLIDDVGQIDWSELAGERLESRKRQLERILADNRRYYNAVKAFGRGRYVKLSGNHDRYASSILNGMIESAYWKGVVNDVLLVDRTVPGSTTRVAPRFVVTHGHQFDRACVPPFADEVGETISECISWAFQGPDRIWKVSDTRQWTRLGAKAFSNTLSAIATRAMTTPDPTLELMMEAAMSHEIAWEYFEQRNPYDAFVREVCTGDEFFKYRHMDEDKLANEMLRRGWARMPHFATLICGHTHEVRDRSAFTNTTGVTPPDTTNRNVFTRYVNTGSAGRFENLIWGVEIEGNRAQVVSWTNTGTSTNIRLGKGVWNSDDRGSLVGRDA